MLKQERFAMAHWTPRKFLPIFTWIVFVGCSGGEAPPDLHPVSGTVRLDGEPVEGVAITFQPQGGGLVGFAATDEQGKFSAATKAGEGLPAGKYNLFFTRLTMPDGSPIPEGAMAADVGAENSLPPVYNDPENILHVAEVKAGENPPLDIDLTSRAR